MSSFAALSVRGNDFIAFARELARLQLMNLLRLFLDPNRKPVLSQEVEIFQFVVLGDCNVGSVRLQVDDPHGGRIGRINQLLGECLNKQNCVFNNI